MMPTCTRRAAYLTEFDDSNANLIWKHPHKHIRKPCLIWAPRGPLKLTHKINHHRWNVLRQCLAFTGSSVNSLAWCLGLSVITLQPNLPISFPYPSGVPITLVRPDLLLGMPPAFLNIPSQSHLFPGSPILDWSLPVNKTYYWCHIYMCRVCIAQGHLASVGGHEFKSSQVIWPTEALCILGERVRFPSWKKAVDRIGWLWCLDS